MRCLEDTRVLHRPCDEAIPEGQDREPDPVVHPIRYEEAQKLTPDGDKLQFAKVLLESNQ